jgi:4-amino-4-deoxy-L-arabinose transferase-like glycosyltransferase
MKDSKYLFILIIITSHQKKEQWLELSTHKIKKRLLLMLLLLMFFSLFIIASNAINFTDTII